MSTSPRTNRAITASSSASLSFPCATAIRARGGARARTRPAILAIGSIRLCTKYTSPPRSISPARPPPVNPSSHAPMHVRTGAGRLGGGPRGERPPVWLGENGGGNGARHLFAALHRFEGGTKCDLGLPIPHIAHQQPVHRTGALHVPLHFPRSPPLVRCVLVQEGRLEL